MKHSHTLFVSLVVFLVVGGVVRAEDTSSQTHEANKTIGNGSPAAAVETPAKAPDGSVLEAGKIIGNGSPIAAPETASRADNKIIGNGLADNKIIGNGLTAASGQ